MSAVHSQSPSGAMTVISANVEGLSANKAYILSKLCKIQHCHCLCLQETHRAKDQTRPKILGMTLVAERPHNKHGSSVFVRDGLKVNSIFVCEDENVEFITTPSTGTKNQASHRNRRFQQSQYPLGDTPQWIATEKRSNNGPIQTDCHSSTTQNCRNHSTVQY